MSSCTIPPALPLATSLTGSGVTVYKSATENSPMKMEVPIIKFEHNIYQCNCNVGK